MQAILQQITIALVIAAGAFLLVWYLAGNEIMRRRGRRLAVWCKQVADLFGGKEAIKWYTLHSFKLDVEPRRGACRALSLTGLAESWDVPVIWLWNRLNWRRDMVLAQLVLDKQPFRGAELYRPRSVLAGDARHAASQEGWDEAQLEEFRIAPADDGWREMAQKLLTELGPRRADLIRLSVRRRDTHLSLALNVPDPARFPPSEVHALLLRLAARVSVQAASV